MDVFIAWRLRWHGLKFKVEHIRCHIWLLGVTLSSRVTGLQLLQSTHAAAFNLLVLHDLFASTLLGVISVGVKLMGCNQLNIS